MGKRFTWIKTKAHVEGNQRIRLVELSDEYVEEDWCEKEQLGYVLEGRITIIFNGKSITFNECDGFFIPEEKETDPSKIANGEKVLMMFVDKL